MFHDIFEEKSTDHVTEHDIKYDINTKTISLRYKNIKFIPKSLSILINLEKLCITHTYISVIPDFIGNLKNLNLSDNMIRIVPLSLRKLEKLEKLCLYNNKIMFLNCLKNLVNLQELHLQICIVYIYVI